MAFPTFVFTSQVSYLGSLITGKGFIMRKRLIGFASASLVLPVLYAAALSPAQGTDPEQPSALSGTTPGAVESVRVTVLPTNVEVGDGPQPIHAVDDAEVTTKGNSWWVSIDPGSIPASYAHDDGVYDFLIEVTGRNAAWTTEASARAVTNSATGETVWVDAGASGHLVDGQDSRQAATDRTARVTAAGFTEVEDDGVVAEDYAEASAPCTYWTMTAVDNAVRSTTMGTTYPVGDSKAWMKVSSSQGAKYGVALKSSTTSGSTYSKSGTKFAKSGWSFTWDESGAARSYRKGVDYTKYDYACSDMTTHIFVWRPVGETGGTSTNTDIARPDWTKCAAVANGVWERDTTGGASYTYSAAVKFASVIGIDLSITREYSSSQFISYRIKGTRAKDLCGNGGNWPSVAGKIMEKFH